MRIAIVTGASSGIGWEFARLIAAGPEPLDELWLVARRRDRLEALRRELPVPARLFFLDLARPEGPEVLKAELKRLRPQVRLLVNAAGYGKFGRYDAVPEQDALGMIDLNCRALTAVTAAALPYLGRGARILQMASTSSFQPLPDMAVYAATKAFVASYSRALHEELRGRGVTCTAVYAGWMRTEFLEVARRGADSEAVSRFPFLQTPRAVAEQALRDSARGRAVSVCGLWNQLHRAAAKLLPAQAIMWGWKRIKD